MSSPPTISLKMFENVWPIAKGSFGTVTLTRKLTGVDKGTCYALKTIRKSKLQGRKLSVISRRERNAMLVTRHFPFICKIFYAFQTNESLYIAMEYLEGGTLAQMIKKRIFSESDVRFYASEIIVALEKIHSMKIIHRDLKPSNIMLDKRGHVKIGDFGLSKRISRGKTYSFCGSPAYIAPEMAKRSGHSFPVDLWALGVVIYEMLMKHGPFAKRDTERSEYYEVLNKTVALPISFSNEIQDLVCKLLVKEPRERITLHAVKIHDFFDKISWVDVAKGAYIPAVTPDTSKSDYIFRCMFPLPEYVDNDVPKENVVSENYVENFDYIAQFV